MMRQLKIIKSITNRDSASLDKYLSDISVLPMITAEEESELAVKIRGGDERARSELVSANLRFVVSVAKQYQNQGISLPDLINDGNLGLIKAASRFDETRGFKFISYAVWWIRQSIMQSIAEQSRVIRLPLNRVGLINKIRKAHDILEQELERKPSSDEIANKLEVRLSEVELTQRSSSRHVSTDATFNDGTATLLDIFTDPEGLGTDAVLISDSLQIEIGRMLSILSNRERDVLVLFYGIGRTGGLSLEEIGEKYSLTKERVRQIKEKAIRALKHKSKNKNLRAFLG